MIAAFFVSDAAHGTLGAWKGMNNPQPTCGLIDCMNFFHHFFKYFPVIDLSLILLYFIWSSFWLLFSFQYAPSTFFPYHSQHPNAFLLHLPFPALHHHFLFRKLPCLLPSEVFASVQKQAVFFLLAWTEVGIGHEDGVFGKRVMLWMRCRTWGSFWNKGFWGRRFLNSCRQVLGLLVKILF